MSGRCACGTELWRDRPDSTIEFESPPGKGPGKRIVHTSERCRDSALLVLTLSRSELEEWKNHAEEWCERNRTLVRRAESAERERDAALAALASVGHTGAEWRTCERCSQARTDFIVWLGTRLGLDGNPSAEEMRAALEEHFRDRIEKCAALEGEARLCIERNALAARV
jgi:hypothetical protein